MPVSSPSPLITLVRIRSILIQVSFHYQLNDADAGVRYFIKQLLNCKLGLKPIYNMFTQGNSGLVKISIISDLREGV